MTAAAASIETTSAADLRHRVRDLEVTDSLNLTALAKILDYTPEPAEEIVPVPAGAPKPVSVKDHQRAALAQIEGLLAEYRFPKSRTKLTAAQREDTNELFAVTKALKSLVESLEASQRETILNDGDVRAEEEGLVDEHTPRDRKGHYLIERKHDFAIEGQEAMVIRAVTPPKPVLLHSDVADLVEEGVLSTRELNSVTRIVREVDDDAVMALVAKRPELAPKIASKIRTTGGSVSVRMGKNAS